MSETNIPMLDMAPEIDALWTDLHAAIDGVLRSGQFIMGAEVDAFEKEIATYLGVRHAVGVNSGTDALMIALRAIGIGSGMEVITTAFTFFATAEAISMAGAVPVFVDVDPRTFNLDPRKIEAAITNRTCAIVPVHLFGQAADMDAIMHIARAYNLLVIEDVAQAFGGCYKDMKLGTIGQAAALSFFPSKTLGAYGDGGMIVTYDDQVAAMARKLRTHGSLIKYHNEMLGYNSRLDAIQAAILRVKLPYVDPWNVQRRQVAQRYDDLLADTDGICLPYVADDIYHVFHQYTIRIEGGYRDAVQAYLKKLGIASAVYYPKPLHHIPVYADSNLQLPHTERLSKEVLSLPIWPTMGDHIQTRVVNGIHAALDSIKQ